MAVVASTTLDLSNFQDKGHTTTWTPLTFTGLDTGAPEPGFGGSDRSVQVTGTLGAAGSVTIEGSNDGVNYGTLTIIKGTLLCLLLLVLSQSMRRVALFVRALPQATARHRLP